MNRLTKSQIVEALNAKLLNEAYVAKERADLAHVAPSARAAAEAEVLALEARLADEALLRAIRLQVAQAGFRKSDYDANVWVRKNKGTKRWDKFTAEQVAEILGAL